jgi:hypothetical protein
VVEVHDGDDFSVGKWTWIRLQANHQHCDGLTCSNMGKKSMGSSTKGDSSLPTRVRAGLLTLH